MWEHSVTLFLIAATHGSFSFDQIPMAVLSFLDRDFHFQGILSKGEEEEEDKPEENPE
jgi:hypothetical protein